MGDPDLEAVARGVSNAMPAFCAREREELILTALRRARADAVEACAKKCAVEIRALAPRDEEAPDAEA